MQALSGWRYVAGTAACARLHHICKITTYHICKITTYHICKITTPAQIATCLVD